MEFQNFNSFIEYYESLPYFEGFDFCSKENVIKILSDDEKSKLEYEYLAFGFMFNKGDSDCIYVPIYEFKNDDGTITGFPDRLQVNDKCIDYWYNRLKICKSDFMKFRYVTLLLDFSNQILGKDVFLKKYGHDSYHNFAVQVIDYGMIILKQKKISYPVYGKDYIEIMIKFGELYAQDRLGDVVNSCISFEEDIAEDDSPGLRGFSCRYFILNNDSLVKKFLKKEQEDKIIEDLENRLKRLKSSNNINSLEHCIELLLAYNDKEKNHKKIEELLMLLEKIYMGNGVKNLHPMVQGTYYDNLKRLYLKYDDKNKKKIDTLNIEIKNLGPKILNSLNKCEVNIPISDQEYNKIINYYYDVKKKKLNKGAFAIGMIPNRKQSEESLKSLANEFPLLYMSNIKYYDKDGVCISKKNDDESQKIIQYQRDISIDFSLDEVCKFIKENNANENFLKNGILLDFVDIKILEKLRNLYINGDNIEFCSVGIPVIESVFRKMLEKIGGNILKDTKYGIEYKNLHDLFDDELLNKSMPIEFAGFIYYCRVLFIEKHGFNFRNNLSHGLDINQFLSDNIANRVFHVFFCLSILKFNN